MKSREHGAVFNKIFLNFKYNNIRWKKKQRMNKNACVKPVDLFTSIFWGEEQMKPSLGRKNQVINVVRICPNNVLMLT